MPPRINLPLAEGFTMDAQELVTGRTCVIAQSGAGKSYLIAVLCEKMLAAGVPFCIIDTEGEYFSLKEKFQLLWAGGPEADLDLESINLRELAQKAVKENVSLIFDVSDTMDEKKTVAEFTRALYNIETKLRVPYLLIVEEADKFAPQSVGKDPSTKAVLKTIEEVSRRGRKRGLGLLIATQRPALVNKNVLSQCGNQLIGKLTTENDLSAVNLFFASRKELEDLPKLRRGQFFAMGNISEKKIKFKSFPRQTQHKGLTPELIPKAAGKISSITAEMLHTKPKPEAPAPIPAGKPAKGRKLQGIFPSMSKNEAQQVIEKRRKKKFGLFGEKEHLTGFDLEWAPLAFVSARIPSGLIRKSMKNVSFLLDCRSGAIVDISSGYRPLGSLGPLAGCSANECKVLLQLRKSKGVTLAELGKATGLSGSALRGITKQLRSRRMITWSKFKNTNYYTPLLEIRLPNFDRSARYPAKEVEASGVLVKQRFSEQSVRNITKALDRKAEIMDFRLFYYPFWTARLQGKKSRAIRIDAVTGKEL